MQMKKVRLNFSNKTVIQVAGIVVILLLALLLLWQGNANSYQAMMAMTGQVYFDGEYRVGDGSWQEIADGVHIPASKGDVTLRGNFHMLAPDGEYVGIYSGEEPVALYTDHISVTVFEGDNEPFMLDTEVKLFGDSSCGSEWYAYSFADPDPNTVELRIHNPHKFGNETAIDEMLSNIAVWAGIEFEKGVMDSGNPQRNIGLLFAVASLMFLGTALFSTLIHIKNSKIIWMSGTAILFAGIYFMYDIDSIAFWSESTVSNTAILGFSMIFYMMFYSMIVVHFLKRTDRIGKITVTVLGIFNGLLMIVPMVSDILFYDLWFYWAIVQMLVNLVLIICLAIEYGSTDDKARWLYIGSALPLISFGVDVIMTAIGAWKGGLASKYIFVVFFIAAIILLLRIIPNSINALARANELETEKIVLNAQLTESRMSTMISQIRPHFIYNTLGSIEQLCSIDPPKAGELVHNFAKYLRGNFGELDNVKPILMSQEMEHVHYYVSIENVRFPDMTFTFEMNSNDFYIPALTVQPIVENAIKHGLMKLPRGGTIKVTSYETDTHYCVTVEDDGVGFDTSVLLDDRKHVGLRNIRGRLNAMVNGTLDIESTVGVGTKVLIKIPKEDNR